MTQKDKEWMEQYIYQVVRRLPKGQREDVGMELKELIEDMLEQQYSKEQCSAMEEPNYIERYASKGKCDSTERSKAMEKVLAELGDPVELAKRYRDEANYLIGPEYYDTYIWFLKVVLLCTLIPTLALSLLDEIGGISFGDGQNYISILVEKITSCLVSGITNSLISCISVFGVTTLVFAVMERQKVKLEQMITANGIIDNMGRKKWNPVELSSIPHKKAIIDRGDSVVGIVFIVIFCMVLIMAPNIFSLMIRMASGSKDTIIIPIFNPEQWNRVLPLFILGLFICLAEEVLKLIMGVYCRAVMIGCIVSGFLQIILAAIILKALPVWNPEFKAQYVQQALEGNGGAEFLVRWFTDMQDISMSNVILIFVIIGTLAEIGVTVYKTIRYGEKTCDEKDYGLR